MDAPHDPGELVDPVRAIEAGLKSRLEVPVEPFDQVVGLRVVGCCAVELGAEEGGHGFPELRCELHTPIGGDVSGEAVV